LIVLLKHGDKRSDWPYNQKGLVTWMSLLYGPFLGILPGHRFTKNQAYSTPEPNYSSRGSVPHLTSKREGQVMERKYILEQLIYFLAVLVIFQP
jgi:hypothetical protein